MAVLPLAAQTNPIAIFPDEDALTPENLKLVWPSTPSIRYEVQQSTNLQSWSTAPGYPATANGPAQQMPFLSEGQARFFQVRELDEQPPAIVSQFPQDDGFAVPRFANLTLQLSDVTGIDTNSIRLTVGDLGSFTLTNAQLTFSSGVLTFINGGSIPLGDWGSNVQATLIASDTLGNAGTNTWSFKLEVQPQVVTNLFVFGSPQAQRTGQRIGNIPTSALAQRFGPIPMGDGDPWTLELVESNRLVLSYTNTAPGFATNTYVCNLTPVRPGDIFNRKITAITDDPGSKRLTLFTIEVPLTEIATNGAASVSSSSVVLQTGTNGAFVKAFEIGGTITFPRIGYSLDGAEFKLKDAGDFDLVKLTLEEQHWWLTPRLQVALEVNWGQLKRLEAIASGNVDAAAVWDVDFLFAGLALEKTIFDLPEPLEPKTWMFLGAIGPVPVYASLGLDVKLKGRAEVHSTLNFRAGSRQAMDAAFGLTYNQPDVQWVNTFNFPPPEVIPFTASINAEGSLKLSLEPALEFLVYGLAGVSAGVTPSGRIVFEAGTGQPLSGRLEADVKLDLKLAGPAFELLSPKPELSLSLWHDEWHLFPDEPAIAFTQQPQSQTVQLGGSAYFFCTVTAPQTPGYQWYFNGVPMPGQVARTLLLPSITYGHAGQYHVRASSQGASLDSPPATLSVQALIVSPTILSVPEGNTATFNVRLQGPPPSSLAITTTRAAGDTDLTAASGAALNFTPANWSIPQPVVVSAAEDDDAVNGQASFTVSAAGLSAELITATEADNDVLALVVSTNALAVPEGQNISFTVRLSAQPTNDLVVTTVFTAGDADLAVASGATLTFTSNNWHVAQSVALAAAEDPDTQNGQATFSISTPALPSVTVSVTEVDDDTAAPSGMVLIPAGSFTMGNCMDPGEGLSDELPVHTVYVSAFYMDRYEVTKMLWDEVKVWNGGNGYSYENAGSGKAANHPVQTVNWRDCVKWCNARSQKEGRTPCYYNEAGWTTVYKTGTGTPYAKWEANGYRLPTEAEWEKAARGGASGHRFPWSDTDNITHSGANYNVFVLLPTGTNYYAYDKSPTQGFHPTFFTGDAPYTSPVGYFAANGYGLYDMAGNVFEWCWDWHGSYSSGSQSDPRGPVSGSHRVLRGGSWSAYAFHCRSGFRNRLTPDYWNNPNGFRAVLPSGQ
jgi:formylglycine-generating enzyme